MRLLTIRNTEQIYLIPFPPPTNMHFPNRPSTTPSAPPPRAARSVRIQFRFMWFRCSFRVVCFVAHLLISFVMVLISLDYRIQDVDLSSLRSSVFFSPVYITTYQRTHPNKQRSATRAPSWGGRSSEWCCSPPPPLPPYRQVHSRLVNYWPFRRHPS